MTYGQIARLAGVSTATVSRVLAGSGYVSEERAEKVLAAAQELHYRSNRAARTLRRRRSDSIGLIVSDVEYPFFASAARSIEAAAAANGCAVLVCNSDEDLARERFYFDLLVEEQVAGVIVAPAIEDASVLAPLIRAGIPVVTLDRRFDGDPVDSVLLDNRAAAELLVQDLVAHGHRRFAAVVGTTIATPSRERLETIEAALETVPGSSLLIVESRLKSTVGVQHALDTVGEHVVEMMLAADERPTAVLCANAIMLTSVLGALRDAGLAVPGDVAVVGFDDMPGFALFETPVTVAAQPTDEIGRTAARLLFDRIAHPELPTRSVRVAPEFHHRRSCGAS
ncbi:LacI family DNA-binding transcriptional regulator [Rathayibacter sp. VKM Ac-2630]|uniref:LacI family DNA-binding transcriptional regulator n=1 Tax=Rathayibacter sp. VKM Ac-2630 TaxID=1938617 RepID=UPI00098125E4|nr:LacI family DNA-binding transcriptional regulator [Rathayibacter sp. VKM Ac-2630]OOB91419.1 hypothetical protein B0T42_06055 [Rathayibacter sp. VKM Ac-2630]